jgi:hypothetical protein
MFIWLNGGILKRKRNLKGEKRSAKEKRLINKRKPGAKTYV